MTKAEQQYADIIHLARPEVPPAYPRQPLSERAKIFSPFAALRGHEERLSEEDDRLLLVEQAELSEEDQRILSEKITGLSKGMEAELTYFELIDEEQNLGRYETVKGTILEVDPALKRIRLEIKKEAGRPQEKRITFTALSDIKLGMGHF